MNNQQMELEAFKAQRVSDLYQEAMDKIQKAMGLVAKAFAQQDVKALENFVKGKEKEPKTIKFDAKKEREYCIKALKAVKYKRAIPFVFDPKTNTYTSDKTIIRDLVSNLYRDRSLSSSQLDEVIKQMSDYAPSVDGTNPEDNFIRFQNGIFDLDTMSFKEDTSNIFIPWTIPHNYDPNAPRVELVDKVFNQWAEDDPVKVDLMFAWIGYNMLTSLPIQVFMIMQGDTRNGKSTYCKTMQAAVGVQNTADVSIHDLEGRFQLTEIISKLASISTENKGGHIGELPSLKKMTSGDMIKIEEKGLPVFSTVCTAKFTFCFNDPASFDDKSGALKERMLVLKFDANFKDPKDRDPKLMAKLKDKAAMEYIIARAVKAVKEAIDRDYFILPEDSKEFIEEQDLRDNPIKEFYEFIESGNEVFLDDEDLPIMTDENFWYDYSSDQIYSAYKYWHKDVMGFPSKPYAKNKFFTCLKKDKKLDTYRETNKETNKKITYYRPRIQGASSQTQLTKK